jgi:hypothetical protein
MMLRGDMIATAINVAKRIASGGFEAFTRG